MGTYRYLCILLFLPLLSLAQGLQFKSKENLIDERTSYHVFASRHPSFSDAIHISFECFVEHESPSGYILRIRWEGEPAVYNLSYSTYADRVEFNLNQEGKANLSSISFDKREFELDKWNKINVLFDLNAGSIHFAVKNEVRELSNLTLSRPAVPQMTFGRSEYLIDVPKFSIRNLTIGDDDKKLTFPLNESTGNTVYDDSGVSYGWVENPVWLINNAYYWTLRQTLTSTSVACVNFNPSTQEVYVLNADSITFYNIRSGLKTTMPYSNKCPWFGTVGTNFIDTARNKIYVYDLHSPDNESTIACLDLSDLSWSLNRFPSFNSPLHHHAGYFDTQENQYLVFGGFGSKHYSNNFYRYSIDQNVWEPVSFKGDFISPRYFSAFGIAPHQSHLYVFGGMGSESGDQYVGRTYNYDLYQLDPKTETIKRRWKIEMPRKNIVPGRGLVVTDSSFYALCYPEYFTHSHLALYQFSLRDGSFNLFGDSIPIRSEKIKTNARLFLNPKNHELCALIQEFENDDTGSSVKIYTLTFPPVTFESLTSPARKAGSDSHLFLLLLIGLAVLAVGALLVAAKRRSENPERPEDLPLLYTVPQPDPRTNAVYLFGEFTVIDRTGRNINYMFSDKLQQLFIVLLHASMDKGIGGTHLNELLWPGRTGEKVKNSRGVAINHLRKILKEMDGISLVYDRKLYYIEFNAAFYCDYLRCLDIVSESDLAMNKEELLRIVSRGKFLEGSDLPSFDSFKQHIESSIESSLLYGMHTCYKAGDNTDVIAFAEALFQIDPLHEEALAMLIRAMNRLKLTEEAKKRYYLFITEYKKSYGSEYDKPYNTLI